MQRGKGVEGEERGRSYPGRNSTIHVKAQLFRAFKKECWNVQDEILTSREGFYRRKTSMLGQELGPEPVVKILMPVSQEKNLPELLG